jgi:hypothetical protein
VKRRKREKHERGQKRRIGSGIGTTGIVGMVEIVHQGQTIPMTGIIVVIRQEGMKTGTAQGVGHLARHPDARGSETIDVATTVPDVGGTTVHDATDTEVKETDQGMNTEMTVYPHLASTTDPHHLTISNQTTDHPQWI